MHCERGWKELFLHIDKKLLAHTHSTAYSTESKLWKNLQINLKDVLGKNLFDIAFAPFSLILPAMESDKRKENLKSELKIFFFNLFFHLILLLSSLKWRISLGKLRMGRRWRVANEFHQFYVPFTFHECSQHNEVFKSQRDVQHSAYSA